MRMVIRAAQLGLVAIAYLIFANSADAQRGPFTAANFCFIYAANIYDLAGHLNWTYHCNPPPAYCGGKQPGHFIHKQIAGYGGAEIAGWLAQNSNLTQYYTVPKQSAIIATAKTLANANKPVAFPPPFFVYDIQFFRDAIYSANSSTYYVGANIIYARCPPIFTPADPSLFGRLRR